MNFLLREQTAFYIKAVTAKTGTYAIMLVKQAIHAISTLRVNSELAMSIITINSHTSYQCFTNKTVESTVKMWGA